MTKTLSGVKSLGRNNLFLFQLNISTWKWLLDVSFNIDLTKTSGGF